MQEIRKHPGRWLLAALALGLAGPALAHEPLFGVGPHTLFEGGLAVEVEAGISKGELANTYEVAYGLTPDLSLTGALPLLYREENGASRFGVGDAALRLKWRFLRLDSPGASDALALVGGVKMPTGPSDGALALGSGSTDLLLAITYGHEGRRFYAWADLRALLTTVGAGINRGDVFFYDLAVGVRPFRMGYKEPDLVVLMEVNGRRVGATRRAGARLPGTGGDRLSAGPALLLSYRNLMFKAGAAFALWTSMEGAQTPAGIEGVIAFEGHF